MGERAEALAQLISGLEFLVRKKFFGVSESTPLMDLNVPEVTVVGQS